MKHGTVVGLVLTALSGCVEIQQSRYGAEYVSAKASDVVTRCMMQTLLRELQIKEEVMERKIVLEGKRWDADGGV